MKCFTITHQLIEHGQVHVLETLTLEQAPILVPTLQQGSLVKLHCILQDLYLLEIQLVSWYLLHKVIGLFKRYHVKPEISFQIKLNPFGLDQQDTITDRFALGAKG